MLVNGDYPRKENVIRAPVRQRLVPAPAPMPQSIARFFLIFAPLPGFFDGVCLAFEAFGANAMAGGGVESLLHEFFETHPLVVVFDPPAPGANAHEFFQVADALQNAAGGHAHQKPDTQDQKHFQGGLAMHEGERMVREN